jgi:Predicted signal transduction protein with a C-terminal ATPase domain
VSKTYRRQYDNKILGIIRLELDMNRMFGNLDKLDIFKKGDVYLVDNKGIIIYNNNKDILFGKLKSLIKTDDIYKHNSGSFTQKTDGIDYRYFYEKIPGLDWLVIGKVPLLEVTTFTRGMTSYIALFSLILILAGFTMIYLITGFFTKRISRLTNEMVKVSKGTFEISVEESTHDEIGEMNKVFSLMIQKLKNSMEEIAHMKTKELELQLKALQAQINPHFLYNTLSSINWMAVNIGADDIASALNSLVTFYRIGLSKGKTVIPIRNELEHVRAYIEIQKIRLKDKIQFIFDIDYAILDFPTPKMLLQPLVENAIYHGIEKYKKSGIITIKCSIINTCAVLEVDDDGIGLQDDAIRDILSGKVKSSGYGLKNIMDRIKLVYGNEYGLDIINKSEGGTKIIIRIPALMEISEK